MTRLDSVIRRLTAQRDVLDWAAVNVPPAGLVLEVGLGNGRTYDHLRDRLPNREIHVFERSPAAHPSCMPDDEYLWVGDIFDTLPVFTQRFGAGSAALIHVDIGTGDENRNRRLARKVSPILETLLLPGGLILGDRAFELPHCVDISAQAGAAAGRYYAFRREAAPALATGAA